VVNQKAQDTLLTIREHRLLNLTMWTLIFFDRVGAHLNSNPISHPNLNSALMN
jgi:hypothetical protein